MAWHDTDDFWLTFSPVMFTEGRAVSAIDDVEGVLRLTDVPPGCEVLDLCCGPGRHSLEFARRGHKVTGVDRTAGYLEQAKGAADAKGLAVEFVLCDAREFVRPEGFALAVNLFTSFGYFEDQADDRKMAQRLCDALRPGGKLVMQMMGKEVIARIYVPCDWDDRDGVIAMQERTITDDWGWVENRWVMVKDGQVHEQRLGHRLYSAAELKSLLREAGFTDTRAFGDLHGAPYDQTARNLVVVATK